MNIFLDKDNRVKIGDLGLSKILINKEINSSTVGTPLYLSPEQIRHQPYGFKVDIWGIGCVLYTLCAFESPFAGDTLLSLGQNIAMRTPRSLPPKYSPKLVGFINNLLEKNPKTRPNIKEAIEMIPLFTKKFYKQPSTPQEVVSKITETPIGKGYEETSSSESIFPRFSSQILDKSMQITLKKSLPSDTESRPITQGTKRLLIASTDAVRVCTAYVKHRYIRGEKPKTTINDLARIL